MIHRNNNLSVLPFYANPMEQNHRKPYAYGEVYPLYAPMGNVPPFQIIIDHTTATISSVYLVTVHGGSRLNITSSLTSYGLAKVNFTSFNYDVILYPAVAPQNITTAEGQYYLEMNLSNGEQYTSDYFTVVADVSGMVQLIWYDLQDFIMDGERIVYSNDYKNTLWLPTLLGKPDYDFEEEGEQRDGFFFPEKMISTKRYKAVFLAPEYLCDVMRFIRLSDKIEVRDNYNNVYLCDTFLATPKWQEQGDLASVDIEFTCDTVAKKVGRGYLIGNSGDYDDDFNDDFNNQ